MTLRNGLSLGVAALGITLASIAPAHAQLLNGGFEAPSLGALPSIAAVTSWGGLASYGISQNLTGGFQANGGAAEGSQYAYLQGIGSAIYQDVTLAAGNYTISWADAGRVSGTGFGGNTSYDLIVGGSPLITNTTTSGQGFGGKSANFTVVTPGTVQVRFAVSSAAGDNTALVDNVVLSGPNVSAPEPGSLALLALAGPGLALFARRRRRA